MAYRRRNPGEVIHRPVAVGPFGGVVLPLVASLMLVVGGCFSVAAGLPARAQPAIADRAARTRRCDDPGGIAIAPRPRSPAPYPGPRSEIAAIGLLTTSRLASGEPFQQPDVVSGNTWELRSTPQPSRQDPRRVLAQMSAAQHVGRWSAPCLCSTPMDHCGSR